jgi:hypothetical protein
MPEDPLDQPVQVCQAATLDPEAIARGVLHGAIDGAFAVLAVEVAIAAGGPVIGLSVLTAWTAIQIWNNREQLKALIGNYGNLPRSQQQYIAARIATSVVVGAGGGLAAGAAREAGAVSKTAGTLNSEISSGENLSGLKYNYDLTPGEDVGQPILFGQRGVSPTFGKSGKFGGATIKVVAGLLKSGDLNPDLVRVQYIWVNGEKVVVNNRSLTALSKAGLKPTNVQEMTETTLPSTGPDSLKSILTRLDEMNGKPSETIPIRSTDHWDSPPRETVSIFKGE